MSSQREHRDQSRPPNRNRRIPKRACRYRIGLGAVGLLLLAVLPATVVAQNEEAENKRDFAWELPVLMAPASYGLGWLMCDADKPADNADDYDFYEPKVSCHEQATNLAFIGAGVGLLISVITYFGWEEEVADVIDEIGSPVVASTPGWTGRTDLGLRIPLWRKPGDRLTERVP